MPADNPDAPGAFRIIAGRLRERRTGTGRTTRQQTPEAARMRAALDMHELGVRLYRQRMRREHPQASRAEIDGMVRAWLAETPRGARLRLPSRERDRDTVEAALRRAVADLTAVNAAWALVGGLAVSARTVPRFTRDLDFAVAVANDSEAEDVVRRLRSRDYAPVEILEQDYAERLSGVRLARRGSDVITDLSFASSGIENEVVANADRLEVLPHLTVPVATTAHLIALKVLAGRNQDLTDLGYLIRAASPAELDTARHAVKLIQARGFSRGQAIVSDLDLLIADMSR